MDNWIEHPIKNIERYHYVIIKKTPPHKPQIERLSGGIFIVDKNFTIINLDENAEELFNIYRDRIIGESVRKIVHKDYVAIAKEYHARRLLGDRTIPEFYRIMVNCGDGRRPLILMRARAFRESDGGRFTLVQFVQKIGG